MENMFVCIDHVGYAVSDIEAAIKFHTEVLGFRVLHREDNVEQGVTEVMLGTGKQEPESAQVQLLAPLNENSTIAKFIAKRGQGIQQVCYRVSDIDAVCADLKSKGVRLLFPEPKNGTAGARINFVHPKDSGGILLEMTEPPAK